MSKFKVGEVCLCYPDNSNIKNEWHECLILDNNLPGRSYLIEVPGTVSAMGDTWFAREYQLKKLPPKDEPTTWQQIEEITQWSPKEVVA